MNRSAGWQPGRVTILGGVDMTRMEINKALIEIEHCLIRMWEDEKISGYDIGKTHASKLNGCIRIELDTPME